MGRITRKVVVVSRLQQRGLRIVVAVRDITSKIGSGAIIVTGPLPGFGNYGL